jgi:hypothetical protein
MSEEHVAPRRRVNPWTLALLALGIVLAAGGSVLYLTSWSTAFGAQLSFPGMDPFAEITAAEQEAMVREQAFASFLQELAPLAVGAGLAAVLAALVVQALVHERRAERSAA